MGAWISLIGLSFLITLSAVIGIFFSYIIVFRKTPIPNKPFSHKSSDFLLSLICIIFFGIATICFMGVMDAMKYICK